MGSLPHGYRHTTTQLGVVWLKQDPDGDPLHLALVVHCAPLQHGQVWQSGEGFPGREALSGASVCSVFSPFETVGAWHCSFLALDNLDRRGLGWCKATFTLLLHHAGGGGHREDGLQGDEGKRVGACCHEMMKHPLSIYYMLLYCNVI